MQSSLYYDKKTFYSVMLALAIPIALQNLISLSLNMIDTVMIGSYGETAVAAVGIGNRVYFFFAIIIFGIYSGMSVFTAQYWGNKDLKNVKNMLGMELVLGAGVAFVFLVAASTFPGKLISFFIKDTAVIELGSRYLRIVAYSYFFTAVSFAVSFTMRSVGSVKIPLLINANCVLINTLLNYIWIFGHLGFEPMGVEGAARATLVARVVECICFLLYLTKRKNNILAFQAKDLFCWTKKMLRQKLKIALPVMMNEMIWSLGMTITYVAYGLLGASAVAAVQVSMTVLGVFEAAFFGIGNACAVMLGNEMGRENYALTEKYAQKYIMVMLIFGIVMGSLLILLRKPVVGFFDLEAATIQSIYNILFVLGAYIPLSMLSYLLLIGILRAGGDIKFCMVLELITIWGYAVPVAFFAAAVLRLPIHWVMALTFAEHGIKLIFLIPRYKTKKWIKNLVKGTF
ncbi:MAG: MATE family efflux transporter [Eubacteriaceae bacterium]|jgi:putative MATE family efflux protein|nr:MATE family efflux transporter [Eubacteriaceae bacterium]